MGARRRKQEQRAACIYCGINDRIDSFGYMVDRQLFDLPLGGDGEAT